VRDLADDLPKGWSFRQIPTTAHGAGRSVFAHYDVATQTPVAGVAHVHLISPDNQIVDVKFKPDDGAEAFVTLLHEAIAEYEKESAAVAPDPTPSADSVEKPSETSAPAAGADTSAVAQPKIATSEISESRPVTDISIPAPKPEPATEVAVQVEVGSTEYEATLSPVPAEPIPAVPEVKSAS
jgi:hypothetical protein